MGDYSDEVGDAKGDSNGFALGQAHASTRTAEIAFYVGDMLKGLRGITRRASQKDFDFLNHLLALAEQEASKLSSRSHH